MQTWRIAPQGGTRHDVQTSLAGLIGTVGRDSFAQDALVHLNRAVQAGSWAVYRVWKDRAPVLHLSSAHGVRDTTRDCFAAYLDGLYRRDRTFDAVKDGLVDMSYVTASYTPARHVMPLMPELPGMGDSSEVNASSKPSSMVAMSSRTPEAAGMARMGLAFQPADGTTYADAALVAGILHDGLTTIPMIKTAMREAQVPTRGVA